jgi:hypothetical protein
MSFLLRQPKRNGSSNDRMRKASASNSERGRILPRPQQGVNRNRKQPQNLQKQSSKPMVQSTGNQILLQRQVHHTQKQQFAASQQRNVSKSQTKTRTTQAMPQKQQQEVPGVISMTEGKIVERELSVTSYFENSLTALLGSSSRRPSRPGTTTERCTAQVGAGTNDQGSTTTATYRS